MRKLKKLGIILLIAVFLTEFQALSVKVFASVDPSFMRTAVTSKLDLRKYFEEAMSLFESGKYKEAVAIFEKLIEVEKANNETYFTPFAEIYIEKSRTRMAELMIMEEKKWERMKKDVVSEAENIARKESQRIFQADESRKKAQEERYRKEALEKEENLRSVFNKAVEYYRAGDYPASVVEFKKIKDMDPSSPMASQGESYIQAMQKDIKQREEKIILVKMEDAKRAKIEMEREKVRQMLELARKEREKETLKKIFEQRLKVKEARDRVAKVTDLMDGIIKNVKEKRFDEAEATANGAVEEFPENEKFKDIAHYIEMQKIKVEESALKRVRDLTEEKMMLDVAKKHILPEEKTGKLGTDKKIMPIVKIPEIRKRLKIPISVDFKDVGLDYVLGFLSDTTGVNIVPSTGIDIAEKNVSIKIKDMP
ncbi:MAG: hypothetical protein Q8N76_01705, partial [Candidatus Omnitrophota bacterium]|nr:hypothetical protein [Candidatus Omnitrophota bacterium]